MQPEKQPTQQEQQPIEKSNQRTNLMRFGQRAYVLGVREREILLIQQSIQLIQEGTRRILGDISWDTIHETSSLYL